ncbi:MAG: Uncharacterised protein [Pseudidiomarina mangrovi]|nr:MAG: Uncharacterised protein [Pseudidiomarina mangrovi]
MTSLRSVILGPATACRKRTKCTLATRASLCAMRRSTPFSSVIWRNCTGALPRTKICRPENTTSQNLRHLPGLSRSATMALPSRRSWPGLRPQNSPKGSTCTRNDGSFWCASSSANNSSTAAAALSSLPLAKYITRGNSRPLSNSGWFGSGSPIRSNARWATIKSVNDVERITYTT